MQASYNLTDEMTDTLDDRRIPLHTSFTNLNSAHSLTLPPQSSSYFFAYILPG